MMDGIMKLKNGISYSTNTLDKCYGKVVQPVSSVLCCPFNQSIIWLIRTTVRTEPGTLLYCQSVSSCRILHVR